MPDNNTQPSLPLSDAIYLETSDAEHARREMSKILAPHAMSPSGTPFHARHHHARLAGLSINFIQYSPGAFIRADLSRRFYLIHYVLSGRCRLGAAEHGKDLHAGEVAVINPTEPFTIRTSDNCGQIVIKMESRLLAETAFRRFGISRETPLRFLDAGAALKPPSVPAVIDLLCREAGRTDGHDCGPRTEQSLAELLAVTLIENLPHNFSQTIAGDTKSAGGVAPWYVRRVEEYIELHADQPLTIRDMTEVSGVSERTLFNGFRTWRELSPKAYLKSVRLDRVRTELLGRAAKSQNVAEIASACGFRHLGNFARDYRTRFGERPSDTLRFRLDKDG